MNADARYNMIRHMFVFGVIIPTIITILVFIGFLICWFKFNLRERLFKGKKSTGKKQPIKVPPHMVANGVHSGVRSYPHDDDEESAQDEDEPDEDRDNQLNLGRSQHLVKHCEQTVVEAEEGSVSEDAETALCRHNKRDMGVTGINNPNLHASPHKRCQECMEQADEAQNSDNEDTLIQQTFHFPVSECSHLSSAAVDSEGSEDGNYGHFVPLSQALKNPKTRQFFAAARLSGDDAGDMPDRTDSHRPVMAGVWDTHSVTMVINALNCAYVNLRPFLGRSF